MRKIFTNINLRLLPVIILCCSLLISCNKTLTKEDVESQANDAKEELQKAKEEVKKAFDVKHDYMKQEQQKLIDHLEGRSKELNNELSRLRNVAEQSGEIALSDVNAAIVKVEQEKNRVDQQLVELNNTNIVRWEDVSRDVSESIVSIESTIDQMVDDLRKMDILIQTHSDTTVVE
ncbi:MAG: hypothetical protein M3512_12850 [Bacteroidota bacterium]|nr:hypothetical protein [Bacteroidota bacterium]